MTEEIINGIDVSECGYLDKSPVDFWCGEVDGEYSAAYCNERPDCYYKQLKRLETENAKLKELLETRCYDEVEFENKKLKEKLETLQDEIGYLKSVLGQIKDLAMCVVDCEQDCDHCMQGQIHQLVKGALNGRED